MNIMVDKPNDPMTEHEFQRKMVYKKDMSFHNEVEQIVDLELFKTYQFFYGIYQREVDFECEDNVESIHYAFQDVLKALHDVYLDYLSKATT